MESTQNRRSLGRGSGTGDNRLSFFTLVFGEFAPKRSAMQYALHGALLVATFRVVLYSRDTII